MNSLTNPEQLGVEKVKSRTSFRTNSLEAQQSARGLNLEESMNGSTRDLFFDCEEDFYMSDNDSSDDDDDQSGETFSGYYCK